MESRVVVPILLQANVGLFSTGNRALIEKRSDKYESSHDILIIFKCFSGVIIPGDECNYTTSYV